MTNQEFVREFKKRQYQHTLNLIKFIDSLPGGNVAKRLGDQLLRSGTSVIANYVEGQSGSSKKDFTNYLSIALKSANESKLWLSMLRDTNRASAEQTDPLIREFDEISKILAASILKSRNKQRNS